MSALPNRTRRLLLAAAATLVAAAAAAAAAPMLSPKAAQHIVPLVPLPPSVTQAAGAIDGRQLEATIRYLADDLLEGRGTGTRGYDLAAHYMATRMLALGLEPAGGGDSTFLQSVPYMSGRIREGECMMVLQRPGNDDTLVIAEDYMLSPDLLRDKWTTDAPLAFAGYGVSAPELGYDDFAQVDVRGKVILTFRGAPPKFDHDQRAYYSNSIVKEQIAAAHGAIGILSVRRPDEEKRVAWERVVRQGRLSAMRWTDQGGAPSNTQALLELNGTLAREPLDAFFYHAPRTVEQIFADGDSSVAQGFDLVPHLRATRVTTRARVQSPNVVGLLRGSDPKLAKECVVISAHLDHLGISTPVSGDSINNGAYDNASGTAMMIEVARAFTSMKTRPKRSILFLNVSGEEKGLQGADYFARHAAPFDLRVVADVNLDEVMLLSKVTTVIGFGAEHSTLGPVLQRMATLNGLTVVPDPRPEEVVFVRSDQFPFVKQGVPSIFPTSLLGGGAQGAKALDDWDRTRYHSPSDDMTQMFDWESGVRFTRMAFETAWFVAQDAQAPSWNKGDYFGVKFGTKR